MYRYRYRCIYMYIYNPKRLLCCVRGFVWHNIKGCYMII